MCIRDRLRGTPRPAPRRSMRQGTGKRRRRLKSGSMLRIERAQPEQAVPHQDTEENHHHGKPPVSHEAPENPTALLGSAGFLRLLRSPAARCGRGRAVLTALRLGNGHHHRETGRKKSARTSCPLLSGIGKPSPPAKLTARQKARRCHKKGQENGGDGEVALSTNADADDFEICLLYTSRCV